jgi:transcriptional regulator with XRE-family HTH domain
LTDTAATSDASLVDEALGARIRTRRIQLGMTLQDLAEASGLTKSFVSQIERGRNSPSISTLRAMAQALGVRMFYFFQLEQINEPVVRFAERRILTLQGTGVTYELLTPNVQSALEMVEMRLAVGHHTGDRPISHEGEECLVVVEGMIEIEVAGATYNLRTGDSIYIEPRQPHRARNTGERAAVIISAVTPPSF